jgi:hypothetical protein
VVGILAAAVIDWHGRATTSNEPAECVNPADALDLLFNGLRGDRNLG